MKSDEEVLTEAIDLLRQGWCKNAEKVEDAHVLGGYRYCAVGALREAIAPGVEAITMLYTEGRQFSRLSALLTNKASEILGRRYGIVNYNDFEARDVEDVVTVFEKARAEL